MQIGLAKTPTMHGGIASAELGFTLCTFFVLLSYPHIHMLTLHFLWLLLPTLVYHCHAKEAYALMHWERGSEWERCVISVWFDFSHAVLSCPLLDSGVEKNGTMGSEGNDKGSRQRRWGCQSRKEVLGNACRAASNGSKKTPCIQISSIIGWQLSWAECMHVFMQICRLKLYLHTHNQHNEVCEVKLTDSYICTHLENKKLRKDHTPYAPSSMSAVSAILYMLDTCILF